MLNVPYFGAGGFILSLIAFKKGYFEMTQAELLNMLLGNLIIVGLMLIFAGAVVLLVRQLYKPNVRTQARRRRLNSS